MGKRLWLGRILAAHIHEYNYWATNIFPWDTDSKFFDGPVINSPPTCSSTPVAKFPHRQRRYPFASMWNVSFRQLRNQMWARYVGVLLRLRRRACGYFRVIDVIGRIVFLSIYHLYGSYASQVRDIAAELRSRGAHPYQDDLGGISGKYSTISAFLPRNKIFGPITKKITTPVLAGNFVSELRNLPILRNPNIATLSCE